MSDLPKLQHQLARARKLADCAMLTVKATHAELLAAGPTEDQWQSMAAVCGITAPSEVTQALTMFLIEDREQWEAKLVQRAKELITKFHRRFPTVSSSQLVTSKRAKKGK